MSWPNDTMYWNDCEACPCHLPWLILIVHCQVSGMVNRWIVKVHFWAAHFPVTFGKIIPFICLNSDQSKNNVNMLYTVRIFLFVCIFIHGFKSCPFFRARVTDWLSPFGYSHSVALDLFKMQFFQSISHAVEPFTQTITVWEHYFNRAFFLWKTTRNYNETPMIIFFLQPRALHFFSSSLK